MKLVFAIALGFAATTFAAEKKFDIVDGTGKVIGQGTVADAKKGVKLSLDLKGAQPGSHAMHLHEKGNCVGPKFETAGGHLNPDKKKHGHQSSEGPHLGDLGNIEVPADGNLKKDIEIQNVSMKAGDKHSLMTATGTSLVFHAKADDEKTDPAGAAGDRIYCGVITEAEAAKTTK